SRRALPPPPAEPAPRRTASAPAAPARSIQDLAITGRNPQLRMDIAGPQGITVGKPAAYVITLTNETDLPADDVQVRLSLPAWVRLSSSLPSQGDATSPAPGASPLVWSLPRLAPKAHQQLRVQLI